MRRIRTFVAVGIVALACAGTTWAFQALPPGVQVNDDPAAGINPALSVSGEDPTQRRRRGRRADRRQGGGAVGDLPPADLGPRPGVRALVRGRRVDNAWQRHGRRALEREPAASAARSTSTRPRTARPPRSTSPAPAGRCRGRPGTRTRPAPASVPNNVFASRFDNTGDANQGKWIFAGQGRGLGGGSVPVPSLNIHTDQDAENPSVAGGSAADPTKPGPWVTWQETTTAADRRRGPDLRREADRPRHGELRRGQAARRVRRGWTHPRDRWLLLAAGRLPACGSGRRRSELERRHHPQRRRAGHRLHRRQRRRAVGGLVRGRTKRSPRPARTTSWCSRPRASATA